MNKQESKEAVFLRLLENHKGILHRICRIYQFNNEDQQDLLQEMMLQLWSSFKSFRGDSQFSSWMYRVALNTAIFFLKKKKRQEKPYVGIVPETETGHLQAVSDKGEQLNILYEAIRKLNKVERAMILLYLEGLSGKEIAEILGISESNQRTRISRVKDKLQYIIKTMGYEYE